MNLRFGLLLLSAVLVVQGCSQPETVQTTKAPPAEEKPVGVPQPKLQTIKLFIGDQVMNTEVAFRPHEVQTGMMFRTNMAENEGMLFVFGVPHRSSFWMKNTLIPLSAAYINPEGRIEEIHALHPLNTNSVTATSTNIQYVLETSQGWFERHNVSTGSVIRTEAGSLRETFFRNQ